jgi:hypothetical protein
MGIKPMGNRRNSIASRIWKGRTCCKFDYIFGIQIYFRRDSLNAFFLERVL